MKELLRNARTGKFLESCGVNPRHYWLLIDLFAQLSERGEMMDQLGRNGVALKSVSIIYFLMSSAIGIISALAQPSAPVYLGIFMVITTFLLMSVLVTEAGNSLINPQEAVILAHQPVNGATYTAAKLSHLARIVLYLVPGINVIPALAGLMLKSAAWYYPAVHLIAAFVVGTASALACCSLFGLLVRFVPVRRLKAAGQLAGALPFLAISGGQSALRSLSRLHWRNWLPADPRGYWGLAGLLCIVAAGGVMLGIRSLSADYLIRVSSMARGGSSAGARGSRFGAIVRRMFGGQAAVAGFAFVSRMMLRDWQFRRMMIPMLVYPLIGLVSLLASGWPADPFGGGKFSTMHLLPHVMGVLLFFICSVLPYGNDYKGVWIFLSVPSRAIDGFARGIFAVLWINMILIPNLIALALFARPWGMWHSGLFTAFSMALASLYLALELRMIQDVPFSKQVDTTRQAMMLPLMIGGGIVAAIVVAVQYFLLFHSAGAVALTAVVLAGAAWFTTRASLSTVAGSIRYHLGLISSETTSIYREIAS